MCNSGNGGLAGVKGAHRQFQQNRAVLADRVQQHGALGLRRDLTKDVNAFRFQALQVAERRGGGRRCKG
jgi:hypothetical protein